MWRSVAVVADVAVSTCIRACDDPGPCSLDQAAVSALGCPHARADQSPSTRAQGYSDIPSPMQATARQTVRISSVLGLSCLERLHLAKAPIFLVQGTVPTSEGLPVCIPLCFHVCVRARSPLSVCHILIVFNEEFWCVSSVPRPKGWAWISFNVPPDGFGDQNKRK
eukprot:CAMPEP_0204609756 /NCGR_PEP_ID=MMETSP0661-20131031/61106_1 /ASSEMBLY_ACC=CAM_ASM_000606 /TAXON_ID=109239 /ORGANISM="Alexandrium margalefi, Strain AMGDE01CS-322" /LENGTH=165 /DNA_ID=CAMNT_0051621471 /DNA_START=357 /DNA_END=851 /DNA_ORIENTATION=+